MNKIVLDAGTVRALSVIGYRNLLKTTEVLAKNVAESLEQNAKAKSDGKKVFLELEDQKATFTPEKIDEQRKGGRLKYEGGQVTIEAEENVLKDVKNCLMNMVPERKAYIQKKYSEKEIKDYDLPELGELPKIVGNA